MEFIYSDKSDGNRAIAAYTETRRFNEARNT